MRAVLAVALLALVDCISSGVMHRSRDSSVDVVVVSDEADAALDILLKLARGDVTDSADWLRLTRSEGYRRLQARESSMGRAFTDSSFRAFLLSDTLRRRTGRLEAALPRYRSLDIRSAAAQAIGYLPPGARIVARLYPMIKPRTNTFVFSSDSIAGIFLYVDPARTAAQEHNTITHELHHIGYSTVCDLHTDSTESPGMQMLRQRMFAFGEGLAMLAAAGGPDFHPHAASDTADRNRWDRDIRNVAGAMGDLDKFFQDVADRRIASPDSVLRMAMTFYGEQGPWYTVGWQMASTIEKVRGRRRLLEVMCSPLDLMKEYNSSARAMMSRGSPPMPVWNESLLEGLVRH